MSDKSMITRVAVLDLMCQIVAEFGVDHVYTRINLGGFAGCYNWDTVNNCPSCLIGHVMHRLGADAEFLAANTGEQATSLLIKFTQRSGLTLEYGVIDVLGAAQVVQDEGGTWGVALHDALNEHLKIGPRDFPESFDAPKSD